MALLSLSISDAGLQLNELTATDADHLIWVSYLADNMVRKDARFTVNDLTKTFSITDGVRLMKAIVGMLEWVQMETVQMGSHHYVWDPHPPTFHWEGDDFILD